jgi:hypothetical protein
MMEIEHNITAPDTIPAGKPSIKVQAEAEVIQDDDFNYDGYQVVRGEFFAHVHEPSITFNNRKVSLNTACLNRLPTVDYVKILVNPSDLKIAVQPSSEDEKDSFIWCSKGEKRKPKQITCRVFFAKIMDLMDWNSDNRYKLLGKLIRSGDEYLFTFDLTTPEIFQRIQPDGGKPVSVRTPVFPAEWKNQFGLPVDEHKKRLQVNIFNGYTVFSLKDGQTLEPSSDTAIPPTEEDVL